MWFGEPLPFPERGSPTGLSASGQQSYKGDLSEYLSVVCGLGSVGFITVRMYVCWYWQDVRYWAQSESFQVDQYKLIPNERSCINEGYIEPTPGGSGIRNFNTANTVHTAEHSSELLLSIRITTAILCNSFHSVWFCFNRENPSETEFKDIVLLFAA